MDASPVSLRDAAPLAVAMPTLREAFPVWLRIGFTSFGGPAGQIALLHRELVERRRWIDEKRFASALSFCTFLPGPEAQQLATYIGWSLHGIRGGLVSGILFFLPASFLLLALSYARAAFGSDGFVEPVLSGLRPVVVAIVADAVVGMITRRLPTAGRRLTALLAFLAAVWFRVPFPWIVLAAAVGGGLAATALQPALTPPASGSAPPLNWRSEVPRVVRVLLVASFFGGIPWVLLASAGETTSVLRDVYVFFVQAALVTFGGAYAVLGYVTQEAVSGFHWLTRREMMDGLALAEATPGPLIIVLEYVGFMAGWNAPSGLSPGVSGALAAALTVHATFLPSLTLVFIGAPLVDRIASNPRLSASLGAILAAATGAIGSLALDLGVGVLWPGGRGGNFDAMTFALLIASFVALRKTGNLVAVLIGGALVGVVVSLFVR